MKIALKHIFFNQRTGFFAWFFVLYAAAGFATLSSYGVHYDELTQRAIGIENARFLTGRGSDEALQQHRFFGPLFETPAYLAEQIIYQHPLRDKILLRRALLFSIFLLSVYGVFRSGQKLFKGALTPTLAAVMYACWPRIWAEAHYNSKDVLFLCMAVFVLWSATAQQEKGWKRWLPYVLAGAACTVRVAGLFLLIIPLWMHFRDKTGRQKWQVPLFGMALALLSYYMLFPALWLHPVSGFAQMLSYGSQNPWPVPTILGGKWMTPGQLPAYYPFLWMLVSLPLFYIILLIPAFAGMKNRRGSSLWQALMLFFAAVLCYLLVFTPTIYNGWRHIYFLFLPLVLLAAAGAEYLFGKYRINVRYMYLLLTAVCMMLVAEWRFGYVYFNGLKHLWPAGSFSLDYWAVGTPDGLLSALEQQRPVKIYTFTEAAHNGRILLGTKDAADIIPVGTKDSADFDLVLNREGRLRATEGKPAAMQLHGRDTLWILYDRRPAKR